MRKELFQRNTTTFLCAFNNKNNVIKIIISNVALSIKIKRKKLRKRR